MKHKRGPSLSKEKVQLGIIKKCLKRDLNKKQPGKRWCLYSKKKPNRVLGRHRTRKLAHKQEVAIKISQRRRARMSGKC